MVWLFRTLLTKSSKEILVNTNNDVGKILSLTATMRALLYEFSSTLEDFKHCRVHAGVDDEGPVDRSRPTIVAFI